MAIAPLSRMSGDNPPQQLGIGIRRHFTAPGDDPYDAVEWERRDSRISNFRDGAVAFEQLDVEVPSTWSLNATNILAQKYFRGTLGTPERETSLKQVADRVVDTIAKWGWKDGYFADDAEAEAFRAELKHLIVTQRAAFNSPVWFNIGVKGVPQQASACQPWDALVHTPEGLVPIGRLVEQDAVGTKVLDASGVTRIVATKANGRRPVLRVHTKAGHRLDVTADHLVWRATGDGTGRFVEAGALRPGDQLIWHRVESWGDGEITKAAVAEAALAGWLQAGGFVGRDDATNRSLTVEAMTVTEGERRWVLDALDVVLPDVHRHERSVDTEDHSLDRRRTRLYGEALEDFVARWGLLTRGPAMTVPDALHTAPLPVVAAYLRSLFQAEGDVSQRDRSAVIGLDMVSEGIVRGVQALLARFGIFSRVRFKADARPNRHGCWSLAIRPLADRRRFADEIGFVDPVKAATLEATLEMPGWRSGPAKRLEVERIELLGEQEVYDIQTESGEYLSGNLRVHNCFILSVDDSMRSILNWYVEEGTIFKGGSGAGINLSKIRSSHELLNGGGTASGPVSFMRGADASAGTIKSGGKTRRAAKMVILNADHPDVEDFIWCKAIEERKARALREAGFDMDLDGKDSHSIQYQNANNSIRVTDEFMQAVVDDAGWDLKAVTTGEVVKTVRARDLMRQISEAAWECADPGMQFDTTINRWHTAANTGRINGSNPCFTGDALVHTDKGLVRFDDLVDRAREGETFGVYTHDATNADDPAQRVELTSPEAILITGRNEIVRLRFDNGMELRCTPSHRIFTTNRGYVEASELTAHDEVKVLDLPAPAVSADLRLPVPTDAASYSVEDDRSRNVVLPEKWSSELAHYLGWVVGGGCLSGDVVTTVYGSEDDREVVLPAHRALLTDINGGREPKPSRRGNGTVQLHQSRRVVARWLEALGISHAKAAEKVVPWSVEQAPAEAVAAFLRGLFDADGCAYDGAKSRYVGLGPVSKELLQGVQRLLTTFGIQSRIHQLDEGDEDALVHVREDGSAAISESKPLYDLRITNQSIPRFAEHVGFTLPAKATKLAALVQDHTFSETPFTVRLVERTDDGVETTYNLSEPRNHSYVVNGLVVRNCSEYMHLDDSACNLASINLLAFLDEEAADAGEAQGLGRFDVEGFMHAVEVVFTAQEILVGNADYPTEKIAETSRRFRQLGLGYANLGALLMALGLPYDSDAGRAWAGAITALMTGHAYATSARTAGRMGPFAGFAENEEHMLNVLRMHRAAAADIDEELVPPQLLGAAQRSWDEAVELGEQFGVRNSQASVLAPTGTIGLLMDCDTTGVEPDLGLCKMKKLVGGGTMTIVNQTVPRALRRLGYTPGEIDAIVSHIDEHKTILGAPGLDPAHVAVFACSMGDNAIHYSGHVRMMGAVQPFISGAISKCVTAETLLATADGLVRIGSLHDGEAPDSFRHEVLEVASLAGLQKTDAFYYGGVRRVREVTLRSGHRVVGTGNHRLLVAGDGGLDWKSLDELQPGDHVATQYGADLWSALPARFDSFVASPRDGRQKDVIVPSEMSAELAFLLGAYAAEGHTTRSNWTVTITNSVPGVLERVRDAWASLFGITARIVTRPGRCAGVVVASKTVVELLDHLGAGGRASAKRIPDAVLRSPRSMVLAFLSGLALDADVTTGRQAKWAICVDSPALLDDLQAVLTNLGIVHGRITTHDVTYDKDFEEVYASGEHAQRLVGLVPFLEPDKAARAAELLAREVDVPHGTSDVVPGISPAELYACLPRGRSGPSGRGTGVSREFSFLLDPRTVHVTRPSLTRVAAVPGVRLPMWLRSVLGDGLHFSPVQDVRDAGEREVFDVSVPVTHAFVGNGIVNHNTVNMPEEVTVEDVEQLHIDAWKLGIKAVAIYRDNCKVAQPLSMAKKGEKAAPVAADVLAAVPAAEIAPAQVVTRIVEKIVNQPARERLPRNRRSRTFEFRVADCKGFVTVGEYDDGRPGEVFMKVSKQGSTLAGIMDAFAISVSHGLQYGVPLKAFVEAFTNMRFEPAGMTDDPDIRFASSLIDYIFRRMAVDYLPLDERMELGILSVGERLNPTLPGIEEAVTESATGHDVVASPPAENTVSADLGGLAIDPSAPAARVVHSDAPYCMQCGVQMQRAGSCHACPSCGTTSGCS